MKTFVGEQSSVIGQLQGAVGGGGGAAAAHAPAQVCYGTVLLLSCTDVICCRIFGRILHITVLDAIGETLRGTIIVIENSSLFREILLSSSGGEWQYRFFLRFCTTNVAAKRINLY